MSMFTKTCKMLRDPQVEIAGQGKWYNPVSCHSFQEAGKSLDVCLTGRGGEHWAKGYWAMSFFFTCTFCSCSKANVLVIAVCIEVI